MAPATIVNGSQPTPAPEKAKMAANGTSNGSANGSANGTANGTANGIQKGIVVEAKRVSHSLCHIDFEDGERFDWQPPSRLKGFPTVQDELPFPKGLKEAIAWADAYVARLAAVALQEEMEHEQHHKEAERLNKTISGLNEEIERMHEDIEEWRRKYTQADHEHNMLKHAHITALERKIEDSEKEIRGLRTQITELERHLHHVEDDDAEHTKKIKALTKQLEDERTAHTSTKDVLQKSKDECNVKQTRIVDLHHQHEDLNDRHRELNESHKKLSTNLESTEGKLAAKIAEFEKLRRAFTDLESKHHGMEQFSKTQGETIVTLQIQIKSLEQSQDKKVDTLKKIRNDGGWVDGPLSCTKGF